MASGIYQLEFATGERYIGKSVDIKARWKQHADKLQKGTAAKPMQDAYQRSDFDLPLGQVLLECHSDLLDEYEGMYINLYTPELNTNIPARRTDEDYDILERYTRTIDGSISSVPALINTVFDFNETIKQLTVDLDKTTMETRALQDGWDDKVAIEAAAIEGYAYLKAEHFNLMREIGKLTKDCFDLGAWRVRVKKMGWWDRLWANWPV